MEEQTRQGLEQTRVTSKFIKSLHPSPRQAHIK